MTSRFGHCEGCEFFVPLVEPIVGSDHHGFCHKNPPQVIVHPGPNGRTVVARAMFPPMKRDEWCGSFVANPSKVS